MPEDTPNSTYENSPENTSKHDAYEPVSHDELIAMLKAIPEDKRRAILVALAGMETNKALRDAFDQENISREPCPNRGLLYHYTNASGLKGIVESNRLWATSVSYMNDSQELAYGWSLVTQEAQEMLNQKDLDPNVEILLKSLIKIIEQRSGPDTYICCFTSNEDQLSQWRGYTGKSVGYSIGFDVFSLYHKSVSGVIFRSVTYAQDIQKKLIKILLNVFTSRFIGQPLLNIDENLVLDEVVVAFKRGVDVLCAGFKHAGFSEECESRFILVDSETMNHLRIRERDGVLIPYVEIEMEDNEMLPIRQIVIGPSEHYERNARTLGILIGLNIAEGVSDENGWEGVWVKKSEISFRHI